VVGIYRRYQRVTLPQKFIKPGLNELVCRHQRRTRTVLHDASERTPFTGNCCLWAKRLDNKPLFLLSITLLMGENMTSERLVKIIQELLETDASMAFLAELKREDLEKLVACVRARLDQIEK
jgi:hypothetical protein